MVNAPSMLYVPDKMYENNPTEIYWDSVDGEIRYVLERKLNNSTYLEIYSGGNTSYTDTVDEIGSVSYRVMSIELNELTWDELLKDDPTWNEMDECDWFSEGEESDWTYSITAQVLENLPPVISGEDGDLGIKYEAFNVPFSVYDPDPVNTINVVVSVNGEIIDQFENVTPYNEYQSLVNSSSYLGNDLNTISIKATNSRSASAVREYTFRTMEMVYFVLRDGIAIAKTDQIIFNDYLTTGEHTYQIIGLDSDGVTAESNKVTFSIKVSNATIALAQSPEMFEILQLREGDYPQTSFVSSNNFQEIRFIGQEKSKFVDAKQRSRQISITYTATTYEEYNNLYQILDTGEPIIYRDHFGNCIIGISDNNAFDFVRELYHSQIEVVINYSITIMEIEYNEEIEYV